MKKLFYYFIAGVIFSFSSKAQTPIINTIAGTPGVAGYSGDNGAATLATLNFPTKVASDALGNIYFADNANNAIRKVATTGIITTIAGNGTAGYSGEGGLATSAVINTPWGVAVHNGDIYFCDQGNQIIRKIDGGTGIISLVAGTPGVSGYSGDSGLATSATLNSPTGLAVDNAGNIYITDDYNNRVRKVNTSGIITTFAGIGVGGFSGDNGPAYSAQISFPAGISADVNGNIYISDNNNQRIRKINTSGIITTVAGNGTAGYNGDGIPATTAYLNSPWDAVADAAGNIYIADFFNCRVRKVDVNTGLISTYAGSSCGYGGDGGPATSAHMNAPTGLCLKSNGDLIIIDAYSNIIRKVYSTTPSSEPSSIIPIVGAGPDRYLFPGRTIQMDPESGDISYLWSPSIGLSDSTIRNPYVTISDTIVYVLRMERSAGVFSYDTVVVRAINPTSVSSQASCNNWVDNYDMESGACVGTAYGYLPTSWNDAGGTCDLLTACANGPLTSVPQNTFGYQNSAAGPSNYAGMWIWYNGTNYAEYLQQQLPCPLVSLQRYALSFKASWAWNSNFACGDIGMYVSTSPVNGGGAFINNVVPQVSGTIGQNSGWIQIPSTPVIITGTGEQYVTIGNFTSYPATCTRLQNNVDPYATGHPPLDGTYNYVDDVQINPVPPDIIATQTVMCSNSVSTVTLSAGGSPGNLCSWSGPGTIVLDPSNHAIAYVTPPNSPGTYIYTVSVNLGLKCNLCGTLTQTIAITVLQSIAGPPLTVTNNSPICLDPNNPPTVGTMTVTGGTSPYIWSPHVFSNNPSYSHVHVNYTAPGTYVYTVSTNNCQGIGTTTIVVNPPPSFTITPATYTYCTGQSTPSVTLTATDPSLSYTWTPTTGLSSPTSNTISVVAQPANTTIYTATGTDANGCTNIATATVNVSPAPVITATLVNNNLCAGSTATINVSDGGQGGTYTIIPSIPTPTYNINSSGSGAIYVQVFANTTYTITVTTAGGCIGKKTVIITAQPLPVVTLSANPNPICPGAPVSLHATGGANNFSYTWSTNTGSSSTHANININPGPTVQTTYSVLAQGSNGCFNGAAVTVTITPPPNITVNNPTICPHTTAILTANGANTYTWVPGAGNPNSNPHTTVIYPNPGTYTVHVTGTDTGTGCKGTATSTITVSPPTPVSITFTPQTTNACNASPLPPGNNTICQGSSAILTANAAGATSYNWTPGNLSGPTVTVTPNVNTVYTVTATGANCPGTGTVAVTVSTCPCSGIPLPIGGNITGPYAANSNVIITSGFTLTLTNADVLFGTGVSLTVNNGAALNIINSHLHACSNMWQGIIVKPGGVVTMSNTAGSNNLIEDAVIAIDDNNNGNPHSGALSSKIRISGTVFNCNRTGIRKGFYQNINPTKYTNTYFEIKDAVLTCRCGITTSTTGFLNTLIPSGATPLPTINSFYQVATLPIAFLKSPYLGQPAYEGIQFNESGDITSTTPNTTAYGVGTIAPGFVLFDNLVYGINAKNSNFLVTDCAFQLPQRLGFGNTGGFGINATNTNPTWHNGIYANNNTFIEMSRGIHNINYYDFNLNVNTFYSKQIAPNPSGFGLTVNPAGDYGVYVKTPRYTQGQIKGNNFYNINNCIDVVIDANSLYEPGGNNQDVGPMFISGNFHDRQYPNDAIATTYIGNAIVVDNVLMSPTTGPVLGQTTRIQIFLNNIANAYRGILVRNHKYQEIRNEINTITMMPEPNDAFANVTTQYGIKHDHVTYGLNPLGVGDDIHKNVITGFTTSAQYSNRALFEPKKGIWCSLSGNHYVTCNSVTNAGRGIEFSGLNPAIVWRLNSMASCGEGFVLSSNSGSGIIGQQGKSGDASDNTWTGFTGINNQTFVDPVNSSLSSVLWVQNIQPTYNPIFQGGAGTQYQTGPSASIQITGPASTFSNCASQTPPSLVVDPTNISLNQRVNQNNTLSGATNQINILEKIALDSLPYQIDSLQNSFINKNILYRMIKQDTSLMDSSAVLRSFFTNNQHSCFAKLCEIEDSLRAQNFAYAGALLGAFSPSSHIEQNYKRFYQIYSNSLQGNRTASDSTDLEILANSCPRLNGAVVYQARAFHNSLFNEFKHYEDHCPAITSNVRSLDISQVKLQSSSLLIYPNPSTGKIYISGFGVLNKYTNIEITDVTGKVILKQRNTINEGIIGIDLSLNDGVYFIHLFDESGYSKIQKIIIQK
ncbi:MAG TPA: T9SS type A sorting domain-containing protein [Bacteroidia bacterium]|jgi:hypothetical protein|nr:T9SS type A sorting domain-containing protein [Bacteroidia bacterium]